MSENPFDLKTILLAKHAQHVVLIHFPIALFTIGVLFVFLRNRVSVLPRIPAKLGKAYYSLATVHAGLGGATEIAGLYILLAAGTSVLPERFRITKYKTWMRTVLVLWWVVLLLGIATYTRWYVPHLFRK
jgi:uncharacterized membrane protein YozB (DUF420 family)